MKYIVPIEIELEASFAEEARYRAEEFINQALFQFRKPFKIVDVTVKALQDGEESPSTGC